MTIMKLEEPTDLLTSLLFSSLDSMSGEAEKMIIKNYPSDNQNIFLHSIESVLSTNQTSLNGQANIGLFNKRVDIDEESNLKSGVQQSESYTPQDLVDMYMAGVNAVRELDNESITVSKSWDPLTLVKLILETVLPIQEIRKRERDRTFEMIKTMQKNDLSNKDVLDLITFVKEHFIDVKKSHEIELAKIKSDNDLRYQELYLQSLEMKMNHQKNMAMMDMIISLLSSALQILSPILENIQSAYPKQSQTRARAILSCIHEYR